VKCPVCFAECDPGQRFCPQCGGRLESERPLTALEEMIHDFRNTLTEHPDDADTRYNLALAQIQMQQFEQAAQQLEQVVRLEPEAAEAYEKLAFCLARIGRRNAALKAAYRALEVEPGRKTSRAIIEKLRG